MIFPVVLIGGVEYQMIRIVVVVRELPQVHRRLHGDIGGEEPIR
jgi:hypothetical protein